MEPVPRGRGVTVEALVLGYVIDDNGVPRLSDFLAGRRLDFELTAGRKAELDVVLDGARDPTLLGHASNCGEAHAGAAWAIDPTGQETGYCCFIATLRDWARLGLMLAHDGAWNGQQIVPRQWLLDATTVSPKDGYLRNTIAQSWGYGYQVWILTGERRMFVLLGTNGQDLLVDPESKLVMVHTAVRKQAGYNPKSPEVIALWYAVVAQYGHR